MERIGDDVRRSLRGAGVPDAGTLAAVVDAWPAAVGPAIARAAWPTRIGRDGTLHVAAVSSTWAFELGRLSADIALRLREAIGEDAPAALRFAPGPVPEPGPTPEAVPDAPRPTPDDAARARDVASAIADDALRETVRRAVQASLAATRADRHF